jgi:phosphoglycerate dehydrogenase-like enzyme
MIGLEQMTKMKKESILINTCRGSVVKEDDLEKALSSGEISYSCSDVFELEPLCKESLYKMKNFWPTSHIAGNAEEAIQDMGLAAIEGIKTYLGGVKYDT